MKQLNYYLCCSCLLITTVTVAVWFRTGDSNWIILSGSVFLSGIIFFLFYLLEEEKENTYYWRDRYFNQVLKDQNDCILEQIDSVS